MNQKNKTTVLACTVIATLLASAAAQASSSGVRWDLFQTQQGAFLKATRFRSFLGSEQAKETIIMTAACTPQTPEPYVTAMIRQPSGQAAAASYNLRVRAPNNNWMFLGGQLDRAASANAGDNLPRYGFNLPIKSPFFSGLADQNQRYKPRIERDPSGGGTSLEIFRRDDKQKVQGFINTCSRYAGLNSQQATNQPQQNQPQGSACRDYLNGPNQFANNQVRRYDEAISNTVCGQRRNDARPAACMHMAMSGAVPYNQQGQANWDPQNAAWLCRETTQPSFRIACFRGEIEKGIHWSKGIELCRQTP